MRAAGSEGGDGKWCPRLVYRASLGEPRTPPEEQCPAPFQGTPAQAVEGSQAPQAGDIPAAVV